MRRHTVGELRTNPPAASAYARRRAKKAAKRKTTRRRHASRGRNAQPGRNTWSRLGIARRFTFRHQAGARVAGSFAPGTVVEFARNIIRVRGPELGKLASHLPARALRLDYTHAQGGNYHHDFGAKARATFHHPGELRITGARIKPFIEG